jgi:hypothetical protein
MSDYDAPSDPPRWLLVIMGVIVVAALVHPGFRTVFLSALNWMMGAGGGA